MTLLPDYSAHPPFLCNHSLSNARITAMNLAMDMVRGDASGSLQLRNVIVAGGPSSYGVVRLVRASVAWTNVVTDDPEFAELIETPTWEPPNIFPDNDKEARPLGLAYNSTPDDVIRDVSPLITFFALKDHDDFRRMATTKVLSALPEGSFVYLEAPLPPPGELIEKFLYSGRSNYALQHQNSDDYRRQAPFLGFAQHLAKQDTADSAGSVLVPLLLCVGETGVTGGDPSASMVVLARKLRRPSMQKVGKELRRYVGLLFGEWQPARQLVVGNLDNRHVYGASYGMEITALQRYVEQGPSFLHPYLEKGYFPKGAPYHDAFMNLVSNLPKKGG